VQNYYLQIQVLIEMVNYFSQRTQNTNIVIDMRKAGSSLYDFLEYREQIFPFGIYATGQQTQVQKDSYRVRKVPLPHMENVLHTLIATSMVFGYSWLENIRAEFEVYDTAKDRK
jgi:hypothetical protein